MNTWLISAILLGTILLLVTEKIPVDLTAIAIMVCLVLFEILSPEEAVAGFAHPAVVTVGSMFIISKGMVRTGAVEFISRQLIRLTKGNMHLTLTVILLSVALASAFINNTAVVIVFIPVVMSMCCEFELSPSQFLIPVSYASILAGTCTLIGTSTNIIVSDLSAQHGFGAFNMFELAALGIPLAAAGLLFMIIAAPKLMPSLTNPICQIKDSAHRRYLAELVIPEQSSFIGLNARESFTEKYPGVDVIELIRDLRIYQAHRGPITIEPHDQLLVKGSLNDLIEILRHEDIEAPHSEKGLSFAAGKRETIVLELIIPPQSNLLGQRLIDTELMRDNEINIIAIKRSNLHFSEKQIPDARLRIGDILLIWCKVDKLPSLRAGKEYIIIEDVFEEIVHQRKAWMSLGIFSALVGAATLGLADIMICALAGALLMILSGCLQMRDVYRSLQGEVLLLIVGTIALGTAMEKTGTSQLYARAFLALFSGNSPTAILSGMIFLTSISSQILSNNATAVLIFPIAVSTALSLGVDPKPFIVGVCFGASACFATPFGYQTNLLVFGPGGYRFSDYLKLGIPLNLLVLIAASFFIPKIWPF